MNNLFKIYKLGDVSEIFAGGDKPKNFSEVKNEIYDIPVYANGETNNGLQGYTDKARIIKPSVTVSARGTIGFAVLRMQPFVPIVRLLTLIPKNDILNVNYLYYYLKLYRQNGIGSSQAQLTVPEISKKTISIPTLNIQQKIAKVLSDLDAKIELNNKINAELEAMAKTLYDYWFVQFDFPFDFAQGKPLPVTEPVEVPGLQQAQTPKKGYKSSGGKMVWNEKLKRDIPEGWEVKELGKILKTDLGGTPSTKNEKFWEGNIPWLNSGEIANFPIVESEAHISTDAILNSATTLMPAGTCVLSITRHLRPSILAIDACANQSVVGIFESEKFKSTFIYPYLKNEIPRLMTLRSGAQQPHINKGTVDESLMIVPSTLVLDKYYKKANPIYKQIINNSFQNQELASLRDWLLPMLMNGQVSVGNVEEQLGMVAESGVEYKKS